MRIASPLFTVSITLISLAMSPLFAADLTVADLRLSVGVLSTDYEGASTTTVTDTGNNVTSSTSSNDGRDADDHWRAQLQYVGGSLGAGGGLIWGIGAAVNNATWNNGSQDAHVTTPTLDVLIGYGYAFTPNWHFELTPFGGYGRAYYSVSDSGSSNTSKEWDHYFEYGAKIGTYVALGGSLVLGLEVPYLAGRFDPDYSYVDDADGQVTVSDKRSNEGFGLLLTLGGRF